MTATVSNSNVQLRQFVEYGHGIGYDVIFYVTKWERNWVMVVYLLSLHRFKFLAQSIQQLDFRSNNHSRITCMQSCD